MGIRSTIQGPMECDLLTEMPDALTLAAEMNVLTVIENNRQYRKVSGAWLQVMPDPVLVQMLGDNDTALNTRIGTVETKFTTGKAATISPVTGSTTPAVVDILGIQVPTGASFTTLAATTGEIKTKLNDLIAKCKSWGWMS